MGFLSRIFKREPVALPIAAFGTDQKKLRIQKTIMIHLQNRIEDILSFDEIRKNSSAVAMLSSAYVRLSSACKLVELLVKGSKDLADQHWLERDIRTALRDLNVALYQLHEENNLSTLQEAYDKLLELRLFLRQRLKEAV